MTPPCVSVSVRGWVFLCSAVLAHIMLNERLNPFGMLGCLLCISGSVTIVLHAPEEREIASLLQVWGMALKPGEPSSPYGACQNPSALGQ